LALAHGEIEMDYETDLYRDVIESIIGQQLSVKAADTISKRFVALFDSKFPTPEKILQMPDDAIRECGISYSKIKYIKGFCLSVSQKEIILDSLKQKSDQ